MMHTIGQRLAQARTEKHLTLEKVSEATRIRVAYLQALEADDHSALPSPVQARGFLRNYAEYLGLNFDSLINELRAEQQPSDEIIGPADVTPPQPAPTPEPLPTQLATPPATLEPDASPQTDAQPQPRDSNNTEPTAVENIWQTWLTRLSNAMPTRRAPKADATQTDSPIDSATNDGLVEEYAEQPNVPDMPKTESAQILREIGGTLRKRRELLSLHLEEVERNTKVKAHYLDALERGAMNDLPSTVQTRGMLSNYASFLDLDVDTLLLRYADALQAGLRERTPQKPTRKPGQALTANMPPLRSFIAGDMVFGIGAALLLIGFAVWGINRILVIQSQQEVQPTAPSISDVLLATPDSSLFTPTATLLPAEALVQATQTIIIPTQNLNVNVQVNLIAVERTFMRVVVDGEEVFNGRTVPGTAYLYEAEEQVEILVGSGAAIRIVYNGRDLGLLGGLGQVVSIIYTAEEIITPTAPPTLTPTSTIPATPTVPPTLTPIPTSTPRP